MGESLTYTVSVGMYLYLSGLTCIPPDPRYSDILYPGSPFSLPLSVMIDLTTQISNCLEDFWSKSIQARDCRDFPVSYKGVCVCLSLAFYVNGHMFEMFHRNLTHILNTMYIHAAVMFYLSEIVNKLNH